MYYCSVFIFKSIIEYSYIFFNYRIFYVYYYIFKIFITMLNISIQSNKYYISLNQA